ncbi:hypothetical protein [Halorubrum halophilum]|uniref:hypothetical protein n=1 Tax=Halorubrum halophilum TaxID=413816 RepID=UPI0012AB9ADA|nr:hypothetical protein [Halorubrum halophilum]
MQDLNVIGIKSWRVDVVYPEEWDRVTESLQAKDLAIDILPALKRRIPSWDSTPVVCPRRHPDRDHRGLGCGL